MDSPDLKLKCDGTDDIVAIASAVNQATNGTMTIVFDANERLDTLERSIDVFGTRRHWQRRVHGRSAPTRRPHCLCRTQEAVLHTDRCRHVAAFGLSEPRQDPRELSRAFKAGAADAFNITAGAAHFLRMCAAADLMERPCWHGSSE